ncbi:MAG: glycosyltransferase family 1 protein [Desulfobacterales bacterium]|nr:glycosyltransferase family 1 protein [Desulfobacterales bacterium]
MPRDNLKVLYEPEIFLNKAYGGVARYFAELIHHYSSDSDIDATLPILFTDNHYLHRFFKNRFFHFKSDLSHVDTESNKIYHTIIKRKFSKFAKRIKKQSNHYIHKAAFTRRNFDLCHFTYYNRGVLDQIRDTPVVITIYDMIYELFPENFKFDREFASNKAAMINRADKIIAISHNTKKDLMRLFNVNSSKIDVIYLGCSLSTPKIQKKGTLALPDNFILYVGKRRGYKNFDKFLNAAATLLRQRQSIHLVCAGGRVFQPEELELFHSLGINHKIHQIFPTDSELAELYTRANFFVFPSRYEGFGLPLVEAFSCHCPVACSNTGSFPEIARDGALFFDPEDEQSIQDAMIELLDNPSLKSRLIQNGLSRMKTFTWANTADETKATYKSII